MNITPLFVASVIEGTIIFIIGLVLVQLVASAIAYFRK